MGMEDLLPMAARGDARDGGMTDGDRMAQFAALCEAHRDRVWRVVASVASGQEAEDLAQDVVLRAWSARRQFRGDASFGTWICRIALNAAHDHRRSAWRRRVWPLLGLPVPECGAAPSACETAEANDTRRRIRAAVADLAERHRVPIWLHYFEGCSLSEVAAMVGVPESTMRSRLASGLRVLARALSDIGVSEPTYGSEETR